LTRGDPRNFVGSWHDEVRVIPPHFKSEAENVLQYKDSAYVFAGGLPYELTEGDVICIFSQ